MAYVKLCENMLRRLTMISNVLVKLPLRSYARAE